MIDRCPTVSPPPTRVSSLHLDYGADAEECEEGAVSISELGMRVRSRWKFELGTELSLDFVGCESRCTVEVTVVSCVPVGSGGGCYECTLLFSDFPDELRASLGSAAE